MHACIMYTCIHVALSAYIEYIHHCTINKLTLHKFLLVAPELDFIGESMLGFLIGTFSLDGLVSYKVK